MKNIKFRVEIISVAWKTLLMHPNLKPNTINIAYVWFRVRSTRSCLGFEYNKHAFMAINRDFTSRSKLEVEHP